MQINFGFHLVLKVEIEYGYYDVIFKDYQTMSPFVISREINDVTFCRNVPPKLRIHQVFHSSLLEPCRVSAIPNRTTTPPLPNGT